MPDTLAKAEATTNTDPGTRLLQAILRWLDRPGAGATIVVALAATSAALLTLGIQTPWAWSDEGATYLALQRGWIDLATLLRGPDAPMVPYYYLAKAWAAVLQSVWTTMPTITAVRLLSAAAATGTVVVLYAIVARNAGRLAGLLSALMLLSLPGFDRYAQEARGYALLGLCASVSWLACDRGLRPARAARFTSRTELPATGEPRTLLAGAAHAVSLALTVVVHTFGLFQWPAHVVEVARVPGSAPERGRRLRSLGWVMLAAGVLAAPSVAASFGHGTGPPGPAGLRMVTPVSIAAQLVRGVSVTTRPFVSLWILALAAAGAWGRVRGSRSLSLSLLTWLLVPLTVEITLGCIRTNLFRVRYWIAFQPPFAALAALGVLSLARAAAHALARGGAGPAQGRTAVVAGATIALVLALQVGLVRSTQAELRAPDGHNQDLGTVIAILSRTETKYPGLIPVVTQATTSGTIAAAAPAVLVDNPLRYVDPAATTVYTVATPTRIALRQLTGSRDLLWIYQGSLTTATVRQKLPRVLTELHTVVVQVESAGPGWTIVQLKTHP